MVCCGGQGEVPYLAGPPAAAAEGEGREEEEAHTDHQPTEGQAAIQSINQSNSFFNQSVNHH